MTDNLNIKCKNCGNSFQGNYCNICGQKVIHGRFTLKRFFHDALSVFNLEKGFFFTIIQLLKQPGKVIKEYLNGRTKDYYSPLKFIIILVGISALISILSNAYDDSIKYTQDVTNNYVESPETVPPLVTKLMSLMKKYLNVMVILQIPFYAIGFRLFFFRSKLNYTEHLITNCYAFGVGTLIGIIIGGILFFIPNPLIINVFLGYGTLLLIYTYFYQRVTNKNTVLTFFLTAFSMIIGLLLFVIMFMTITFSIVFLLKKLGLF